jgi:hypothetical protein
MNQSMPQPSLQKMILPKIGVTYGKGLSAENQYMIKEYLRIPTPAARLMRNVVRFEGRESVLGPDHPVIRFESRDGEDIFQLPRMVILDWTHPPLLPALHCKPSYAVKVSQTFFDCTGVKEWHVRWPDVFNPRWLHRREELIRLESDPDYARILLSEVQVTAGEESGGEESEDAD